MAGVPYAKVNPLQARRFAEAIGRLAKTDRLDAAMLARMGAMFEAEDDAASQRRLARTLKRDRLRLKHILSF